MKHIDTMLSVFQRHSCICQVIIWTPEGPISYASESLIVIFLPWYNCYVYVLNDNKMFLNWKLNHIVIRGTLNIFLKTLHLHVYYKKDTKIGNQNFGYQIWFCTRLFLRFELTIYFSIGLGITVTCKINVSLRCKHCIYNTHIGSAV